MQGLAKVERTSGAMELTERPMPEPDGNEALVEVDYAGLCGSDAGIYEFESAFDRMDLPTVIGHEYAGTVVEIGADVTKYKPSDRVVERPIRSCGECYQCRIGETNVCQDAVITGVDHHGAYERYISVPEEALHPVPDGVDQQQAAVAEPTSVAARAVIENSRVGAGDRILVEGPGPIGLLTAQIARSQGGTVAVSGIGKDTNYRLPLAEELGFETINIAASDTETRQEQHTDSVGYDVVFDTTGHPSGLTTAVEQVRKGGQIVLVGQTGETTMPYSPLVRAEINLQCSYASMYQDFERSFRLIRNGAVDCETFVDTQFSLYEVNEAFEMFIDGGTCKPVFDVSELR